MALGTGVDSTMAVLVSTLNATVIPYIEGTVYDEVYLHNPVLYRFHRKGKTVGGGSKLLWPIVKLAKTKGGWYTGAGQLPHGVEDTVDEAEVLWRHAAEDVTIPRTDLLKARGIYAKVELTKLKFDEAVMSIRSRISQALYATTDPAGLSLDHLFQAIDDGNDFATYAGIAHSNSFWKAGITGAGRIDINGAVVSLSTIEQAYSEASDGDEQPTLGIMTAKAEQFIWGQLQALQRYVRDEEMTKAGFEAFKFNRAVMVTDRNMPTTLTAANEGKLLFINERWVDLVSHEEENFAVDPILPGTPSERSINTKIAWSGNVRVKSPRYCSKLVRVSNF